MTGIAGARRPNAGFGLNPERPNPLNCRLVLGLTHIKAKGQTFNHIELGIVSLSRE
jgi:hypothetical protein